MQSTAPRGSAIDHDSLSVRQRRRTKALSRAGAFLKRLIGRRGDALADGADIERRILDPDVPVTPKGGRHPDVPVTPKGGRFITEVFANFAGMRNYKLFIPSAYRGQALPLIVMLHGCKQWPDDFAAGTRMNFLAEETGCFVAYPAQPKAANGSGCWNWFSPRHQHRGRGEPSIIAGITREVMRQYGIDPARVYVAGLSAGGAATAVLAATYPDLYAAVGIHSGLARGSARNVQSALAAMRNGHRSVPEAPLLGTGPDGARRFVPAIIFHGDRDDTVHPRNADHVIAQILPEEGRALRVATKKGRAEGGHGYSLTRYVDPRGLAVLEYWSVHNSGHAWSGGDSAGSYTDSAGPDASREILRFFLTHRLEMAGAVQDAVR